MKIVAPPSPLVVGDTIRVIANDDGLDDDLGRLGVVQEPSPHLPGSVRVLLEKDSLIRWFNPDQLERVVLEVLPPRQQAAIERWESKNWSISTWEHEWCEPGEIYLEMLKGTQHRALFVSASGWTETQAQREQLRQWRADGWSVSLQRGPRTEELRVHIQGEHVEKTVILAPSGWIAQIPSVTPWELCTTVQQLETSLQELKAAQKEAEANGGMTWTTEWKGVSIQEYCVQKTLKSGVKTQFWYHRLECHRPMFPVLRQSKKGQPYTKKKHISKEEYPRYRSAKFRYDEIQAVYKKIHQLSKKRKYNE